MKKKLGQNLKLSQSQRIVMIPQMQQAVRWLSLPLQELNNEINTALGENPLLEIDEYFIEQKKKDVEKENEGPSMEDFEGLVEKIDIEWDSQSDSFESSSRESNPIDTISDSPHEKTLTDHLTWQLGMEDLGDNDYSVALGIIHNLSEEGFLETPLKELAQTEKWDWKHASKVRSLIQHLDPLGCGSDNWQDCLLFQVKIAGCDSPLLTRIIQDYFNKKDRPNWEKVATDWGVEQEEFKKALQILEEFNSKPGLLISNQLTHYVAPDVYAFKSGDRFIIKVNEDGIPPLKISQAYEDIISSDKKSDKQTVAYIQEKIDGAKWIINSIQRRKKTLYQVADAILSRQQEFFQKGIQHLKPMILKDIAKEIGVHESTVSRAVTNKYMHTPKGIFELKYFFDRGVSKKGKVGGISAAKVVPLKIRAYIDSEGPDRPLSDQRIVEILKRDGISLARRTVAKYRVEMGIPPASKRKGKKVSSVG